MALPSLDRIKERIGIYADGADDTLQVYIDEAQDVLRSHSTLDTGDEFPDALAGRFMDFVYVRWHTGAFPKDVKSYLPGYRDFGFGYVDDD